MVVFIDKILCQSHLHLSVSDSLMVNFWFPIIIIIICYLFLFLKLFICNNILEKLFFIDRYLVLYDDMSRREVARANIVCKEWLSKGQPVFVTTDKDFVDSGKSVRRTHPRSPESIILSLMHIY